MTTVRAEAPAPSRGVRLPPLDRPPANAINGDLLTDLSAALDAAAGDDSVRAVVITGAGPFFSGGARPRAPPGPRPGLTNGAKRGRHRRTLPQARLRDRPPAADPRAGVGAAAGR